MSPLVTEIEQLLQKGSIKDITNYLAEEYTYAYGGKISLQYKVPFMFPSSPRLLSFSTKKRVSFTNDMSTKYLNGLERCIKIALYTLLFSALIGILAINELILFARSEAGVILFHPFIAIFLALGAMVLFGIALYSLSFTKRQLRTLVCGIEELAISSKKL